MIIYSFPELKYLAKKLDGQHGKCKFDRFKNGEWYVRIGEKVKDKNCAILGAFTPPDENLLKSLVLAHTLKKEGAKRVVMIMPYLAYTRHDKNKQYESFITDWIGKVSTASGLDKIITIDIHSKRAKELIKVPLVNISPVQLFLTQFNKKDLRKAIVIAPDEGALDRAEKFRKEAGVTQPVTYFKKTRLNGKIVHSEIIGSISENVIIVDDILDTGGTLVSCAEQLKKRGVKTITVVVSHGLFSGKKWLKLFKLNVKRIITTDSTPTALRVKNKKVKVVSCANLLMK